MYALGVSTGALGAGLLDWRPIGLAGLVGMFGAILWLDLVRSERPDAEKGEP